MRSFAKVGLAVGLGLMLTAQAWSQQRGGRGFGGGPGGPGMLAQNKSVQQELKLSDEQVKKIGEALTQVREKHQEEFQNFRDLSEEERTALRKKVNDETSKELASILTPDQMKRFKQIELQQRGVGGLLEEDVEKALKLTDDQKDKIKTINEDAQKERRSLFQAARQGGGGGGGGFAEVGKKMAALNKESMDKAMAVLTPEQVTTYKEMTGTPFDVKFEFGRGGRGRGQGKRDR
jgi:Spy/CpxP family protein refolding chaperone